MARKTFCAVGLLVAMLGTGVTLFGMQNIDTGSEKCFCHGRYENGYCPDRLVTLPGPDRVRRLIWVAGLARYAQKSALPEKLGNKQLPICVVQNEISKDVMAYIKTLQSPIASVQKGFEKEADRLLSAWFYQIFDWLVYGRDNDCEADEVLYEAVCFKYDASNELFF